MTDNPARRINLYLTINIELNSHLLLHLQVRLQLVDIRQHRLGILLVLRALQRFKCCQRLWMCLSFVCPTIRSVHKGFLAERTLVGTHSRVNDQVGLEQREREIEH